MRKVFQYDRNSNRLYRENVVAAAAGKALDQLYSYDCLNRPKTRLVSCRRSRYGQETDVRTAHRPTPGWQQFRYWMD